ncbi:MAG: hypothetical protein QOF70_2846 [Acetobacteraceae bacterium]|nr:hypothetical protein [Acetobacteraceae bacterium]
MPDGSNTTGGPRPADTASRRDPTLDLITRLDRDASTVAAKDPDLSRTIHQLADAAAKRPERTDDVAFRTRVAYALQDMEKLGGPIGSVPQGLREEMSRLAVTAPGLKNDRLQEMMRATPSMDDARLVRDIRSLATNVGARGGDQNGPDVRDRVEVLENRIRMSASGAAPNSNQDPRPENQDERPGRPAAATNEQAQAARSPGNQASESQPAWTQQPRQSQDTGANNQSQPEVMVTGRGPGIVARALASLARNAQLENPPWDRQPTSVADRADRHENTFQQRRDEATIQGAEKSQRAALNALQAFASGPGSNILTKIQDAAKAEPGGMPAVLSEMREGGRFAGLRSQFNADLVMERGAAAAWDRMAGSLQQYGADRTGVAAIGARQNSTAALDARFEKMDAEISKAASIIPSKQDGKSVVDDLGDKLREILNRAVEAVKSVFTPSAERNARASANPSPAP